jgi:hypothetical protein
MATGRDPLGWPIRGLKARIARPMFRLHLLLAAVAEGDGVIREAIGDIYQEVTDKWEPTYEKVVA